MATAPRWGILSSEPPDVCRFRTVDHGVSQFERRWAPVSTPERPRCVSQFLPSPQYGRYNSYLDDKTSEIDSSSTHRSLGIVTIVDGIGGDLMKPSGA